MLLPPALRLRRGWKISTEIFQKSRQGATKRNEAQLAQKGTSASAAKRRMRRSARGKMPGWCAFYGFHFHAGTTHWKKYWKLVGKIRALIE